MLDLVILSTAMLLVPMAASAWNETQGPDGYWSAPVPAWAVPVAWFLCGVYLTAMTHRGATLGMRVADLRVIDARSGGAVGWLRAAVRALAMLAVLWLAVWGASITHDQLLVPLAYGLTMLLLPQRRLPHDLLAGTRVVRRPARGTAGLPDGLTLAVGPDGYDDLPARELLGDLSELRHRVRGDMHASSVLLSALGVLALGGAAVSWSSAADLSLASLVYWKLAAPLGLLVVAAWFELLRRRVGIAPSRGWLTAVIIVALAASLVSFFLLGPGVTALVFLGLAVHERSRPAAVGAVLFAVVSGPRATPLDLVLTVLEPVPRHDNRARHERTRLPRRPRPLGPGPHHGRHARPASGARTMTPATPDDAQPGPHPSTRLNDDVHPRARLGILTVLAEVETATFGYLKSALQLTDGNLGRHLETLAAKQLVTIRKGYEGRRARTWVTITDHGREEIASEVAGLKALVTQYERAARASPRAPDSAPRGAIRAAVAARGAP